MSKSGEGKGPTYRQVGLPAELADEITELKARHPWLGLGSVRQFALEACRDRLFELEKKAQEYEDRAKQQKK